MPDPTRSGRDHFPVDGIEPAAIDAFTRGYSIDLCLRLSQAISLRRIADNTAPPSVSGPNWNDDSWPPAPEHKQ